MVEAQISAAARDLVRTTNILCSNDLAFHRSLDSSFSRSVDSSLADLLETTNSILSYVSDGSAVTLSGNEEVQTKWINIIDVVDSLLEKSDRALEELTAQAKREKEAAALKHMKQQEKEPLPANLRNAQDLPHPQLKFDRKPDNTDEPFSPLLTEKPNAKISLEESLTKLRDHDGVQRIGHPYAYEIDQLTYPEFIFVQQEPIMYHDVESTKATWVNNKTKLRAMLKELKMSREIAIDLEHHDFHSFRGFVCLMQISNRNEDWIVDTLALRSELMVLNEVFTDPSKLKVFHGANSDIIWLQRDFGLYIVNLFDTYHASKALGLDGHGLAYLLSKYVNFEADKRYQLADWRIRPLPKEMLYYARSDTHYLLYIYDLMRNELLQKSTSGSQSLMTSVLQASAEVSQRQYIKEPYDAAEGQGSDGWQFLLQRFYGTRAFDARQLEVLKALHQWRDQKAREKDESTRFILPNQAVVAIAAALPKDTHALLSASKQVSSTMQANLKPLLNLIELAMKRADQLQESQPRTVAELIVPDNQPMPSAKSTTNKKESDKVTFSTQSTFWGSLSTNLRKHIFASPLMDLRLTVPLPALNDNIYQSADAEPVELKEAKIEPAKQESEADKVFVVKDVGRAAAAKRKSEAMEQSASVDSPEAQSTREARKKAKQAKAEQKAAVAAAAQQAIEPEAFDYAAQPSILQEKEQRKSKMRKFGEFAGKIVRSKQVQGGKQSTFKR